MKFISLYILNLLSLLLFCLFISCDSDNEDNLNGNTEPVTNIDSELQPHLDFFINEATKRQIDIDPQTINRIKLRFTDLPPNTLGLCAFDVSGSPIISISNNYKGLNSKWITLHELGHCILRMKHRDTNLSIMNTANSDSELNSAKQSEILDEFFTTEFFYSL